jgi:peptide deformylase
MSANVEWRDLDSPRVYPNPDIIGVPSDLVPNLLTLEYWPSDTLHEKCEDVVDFNDDVKQFVYDLAYTMHRRNGIGLAAPQVGKLLNVIIVETLTLIPMVNPRIVESDDKYTYSMEEGCLSVPGYYEKRSRPQRIIVEYQKANGIEKKTEFQGMAAFLVQHEIDHLSGKVFVDDLSNLKKDRIKKKMKKFKGR